MAFGVLGIPGGVDVVVISKTRIADASLQARGCDELHMVTASIQDYATTIYRDNMLGRIRLVKPYN